jgi:Protein of unknown function (DUF642)
MTRKIISFSLSVGLVLLLIATTQATSNTHTGGFRLAAPLAVNVNLVQNGNFEDGFECCTTAINGGWPNNAGLWDPIGYNDGANPGTDTIPGWTVSGGGVDWSDSSAPQPSQPIAQDGFRSVDLNSCCENGPGAISQTIATTPGTVYSLSFHYSGHPYSGCYYGPKSMKASAGGASIVVAADPLAEGYLDGNNIWHAASFTFTASSSSTVISFESLNFVPGQNNCAGPLVDNVSVVQKPLPTTTDECKNGGWQSFGVFKNQGDCVSFVATQGKNPPAH